MAEEITNALTLSSNYTAIATIATGATLALLKLWIPSEDDIRNRTDFHRTLISERVNKSLTGLLQGAISASSVEDYLRLSASDQPDRIAEYSEEVFRAIEVHRQLDSVYFRIKLIYTYLFTTVVAGVMILICGIVWEPSRPYLSVASMLVLATQVTVVLYARMVRTELEKLEKSSK